MAEDLKKIFSNYEKSNFHAHTPFCDGRDEMDSMVVAAIQSGFEIFSFSPHSPVPIPSPCNMEESAVKRYFEEFESLRERYAGRINLLRSMEIDYLGTEWGPHTDYFQQLPLDYRLGSVHFIPTSKGELIDCDGNYEKFRINLHKYFHDDIRYVVEKYYEQMLGMMEKGGVDIIGHLDKIASNACGCEAEIDNNHWYEALIDDAIRLAEKGKYVIEINTKSFENKGRFFPSEIWWDKLIEKDITIVIDSDAHYAAKVTSGRQEAIEKWKEHLHK